jgi:arylformamidase
MQIWDVSRSLTNNLAPWPGDTPFDFRLIRTIPEHGVVNLGTITMSVHNGTHADGMFHFDQNGATVDRAPLENYFGRAAVVDLSGKFSKGQRGNIEIADLATAEGDIRATSRVLFKTGMWKDSTVFPEWIPVMANGVVEWLQERSVRLIGLDLPSVDTIEAKVLQNHRSLGRAGIWIVESLDLGAVSAGLYNLIALPVKIGGGDGAPVRAILWRE